MPGPTYNKLKRSLKYKSMQENNKSANKKTTDTNHPLNKLCRKTVRNCKVQTDDIKTVCNILSEGKSERPKNDTVDIAQPSNSQSIKKKQIETFTNLDLLNQPDTLKISEPTKAETGLVPLKSSDDISEENENIQINEYLSRDAERKNKITLKENEQQTDLDMKKMNEMIENEINVTSNKSHLPVVDKSGLKNDLRDGSQNSFKFIKSSEKENGSISPKGGDVDAPVMDRKKSVSFAGLTVVDIVKKPELPTINFDLPETARKNSLEIPPPEITKTDKRRRKEEERPTKDESEKMNLKQLPERPETDLPSKQTESDQTEQAMDILIAQQTNFVEQGLEQQTEDIKDQTTEQRELQVAKAKTGESTPLEERTLDKLQRESEKTPAVQSTLQVKPPQSIPEKNTTEQPVSSAEQLKLETERSNRLKVCQQPTADNLVTYNSIQEDSADEDLYDEFDHFALDVAEKLKTMAEDQIILAEKLISSVIISGEFGKLNLNTAECFKRIHSSTTAEEE